METTELTREAALLSLIMRDQPRAMLNDDGLRHCSYSHRAFGGCAIGCLVTAAEAESIDMGDFENVFSSAPGRLVVLGVDFLQAMQYIHDDDENWINAEDAELGNEGLVWHEYGIDKLNDIIVEYNVKLPLITLNQPYNHGH